MLLQVSVVDELGIPVKFVGVGEGVEDLQPFDDEAFIEAVFSWGWKSVLVGRFPVSLDLVHFPKSPE